MVWFVNKGHEPKLMLCQRKAACKTFVGWWAAVGGKVDMHECAIRAVQREMMEETDVYISRDELVLIDSYQEGNFKCFIFETELGLYRFNDIKNLEPKKHTPWQLFTTQEALALPNLMPALREILLTK